MNAPTFFVESKKLMDTSKLFIESRRTHFIKALYASLKPNDRKDTYHRKIWSFQ